MLSCSAFSATSCPNAFMTLFVSWLLSPSNKTWRHSRKPSLLLTGPTLPSLAPPRTSLPKLPLHPQHQHLQLPFPFRKLSPTRVVSVLSLAFLTLLQSTMSRCGTGACRRCCFCC
jgi:hypothetical protein